MCEYGREWMRELESYDTWILLITLDLGPFA